MEAVGAVMTGAPAMPTQQSSHLSFWGLEGSGGFSLGASHLCMRMGPDVTTATIPHGHHYKAMSLDSSSTEHLSSRYDLSLGKTPEIFCRDAWHTSFAFKPLLRVHLGTSALALNYDLELADNMSGFNIDKFVHSFYSSNGPMLSLGTEALLTTPGSMEFASLCSAHLKTGHRQGSHQWRILLLEQAELDRQQSGCHQHSAA